MPICRDFYRSDGTRIRDLRPDRPAFTSRARALHTRRLDDRREALPLRQKRVAGVIQIASVLQASRFRCDVTVFRLNAAARKPGAFRCSCGRPARTGSMAQTRKTHRDDGTAEALQAEVGDRLASDVMVERRVRLLAEQDLAGSRDIA